jgi:HlyD family secretion protein
LKDEEPDFGVVSMTSKTLQQRASSNHKGYAYLGYFGIAIVFAAFGGFAWRAPLDSAAIAPGRVMAETATKPIQHLEGGIVREVLVKESTPVHKGDVLFRLVPTRARANAEMLMKQVDAAMALEARLLAERDRAERISFPAALLDRRHVPETAAAVADQRKRFDERRQMLDSETRILKARLAQAEKEHAGLTHQATSLKEQLENLNADIEDASTLMRRKLYRRSKYRALLRDRSRLEGQLGTNESEIARAVEATNEARLQIDKVERKFVDDASQQLPDVRVRLSDLREKMTVASDVMSRIEVRAPQNGIVQGLKVHAAGAVVKPGEALAELVPTGDKLVMAARVSPLDIDNVAKGQHAEIRFPAFSSRKIPTILGNVETVAGDAMLDEYTREPYFLARVIVDTSTIPNEIHDRLVPGMPADVLIITGERTLLEYLFSPITDLLFKSMRET